MPGLSRQRIRIDLCEPLMGKCGVSSHDLGLGFAPKESSRMSSLLSRRQRLMAGIGAAAITLLALSCGGGDEPTATTTAATVQPPATQRPAQPTTPPGTQPTATQPSGTSPTA